MIKHQFSDRSRFVIKASMKSRCERGLIDFNKSLEWENPLQEDTIKHLTETQKKTLENRGIKACKKLMKYGKMKSIEEFLD